MYQLTYWEDPKVKHTPDDFDGILTVYPKRMSEVPAFITQRPANCTMISIERSTVVKLKNGTEKKYFREVWRKGEPVPEHKPKHCVLCGKKLTL